MHAKDHIVDTLEEDMPSPCGSITTAITAPGRLPQGRVNQF